MTIICEQCGKEISKPSEISIGTGYGYNKNGDRVCYDCCADNDRSSMITLGYTNNLYIMAKPGKTEITNWPGTLRFTATKVKHSTHHIPHYDNTQRTDVWFVGPDEHIWHGVNIGDNDNLRCKRIQRRAK